MSTLFSVSPWTIVFCLLLTIIAYSEYRLLTLWPKSKIPIYNNIGWAGSYLGGIRFFFQSQQMVFGGYKKHSVYKVPRWSTGWAVIISGAKLVDELHRLPDDVCSLEEAAKDEIQTPHTMGSQIYTNPYHLSILNTKLNRHTDYFTAEILDEAVHAFEDLIGSSCSNDWMEFNLNDHITQVVTRIFNRILVGVPLCRNSDFNKLGSRFSVNVYVASNLINLFPPCLRNVVGNIIGRASKFQKEVSKYLEPLIEERRHMTTERGLSWSDKPTDILSLFMDRFTDNELDSTDIQNRILTITAATSHTSSYTFMQAMLNMASHPEAMQECTIEAEEAIRSHGWTRECIDSLAVLDSFFKESMRLNGLASMSFPRKMMKPYTLSDGTCLPAGSFVSASFAAHFDGEYYKDPYTFDAHRHICKKNARINNAMVTTSSRFLPFGHGTHACPGRFLVSYALKALMVHILVNYDLKLGGDGVKKPDFWFSYHCTPNASSSVVLRRRVHSS